MAELPGLAAGSYVPFLFQKSQAASADRKPAFSVWSPAWIFVRPGGVEVGEKCLLEGEWCRQSGLASAAIRR
jgi:hypothetical protein